MRVIAGKARGKKLLSPQNNNVRPTLDRVKESLFNIIGFNIRESVFLDLFCGSASIGIEALSRDAAKVYFVDRDLESINLAKKNIESCKFSFSNYEIIKNDVMDSLTLLSNKNIKFDYIFMDPPYVFENTSKVIEMISQEELLDEYGMLVVETDIQYDLEEEIAGLKKTREKKYSIIKLTFYERTESNG